MNTTLDLEHHLRGQGLADRTVAEYVKWARRLGRWCQLHGHDVASLPAHRLRDWIDATVPAGRESRKQAFTACKHLYRMVGRDDEPWLAIRVPRKRQGAPDPFTDVEAGLLRDAAILAGGRAGLATLGLLYTAARPSEVAQWRWENVDWQQRTVRFWRPKVSGWHCVPVLPTLGVALEKVSRESGPVFVGNNGREYVSSTTVLNWTKQIATMVGVDRVTPRRFRHTVGSKIANSTGDVQAAAAVMGNSVEVASRFYTKVAEERVRGGLESLPW